MKTKLIFDMYYRILKLSIFFVLVFMKLNAQSFSLETSSGNILNNGDTLVVSGTTNDFTLTSPLDVINNSNSLKTVLVERTLLSMVTGTENAFAWWLYMYAPSVSVSIMGSDINAGATDSSFFTWYFSNGFAGVSYVKYRFYDQNNPADSAWMVFEFNVTQSVGLTAFNNENNSNVYPNPSTGIFNISSKEISSNASADIFDMYGKLIFSKSFTNRIDNFPIDLSEQPNGFYLLKLMNEKNVCVDVIRLLKN